MDETEIPDSNAMDDPYERQPTGLSAAPSSTITNEELVPGTGRVAANTAFMRARQNVTDVSGFENSPDNDGQSGITPAEDDDGGEAASARIAQEYRRQVRIKRLAEEIQQAERAKKKEEESRRQAELDQKQTGISKKKEETTKLTSQTDVAPDEAPASDATLAKRRAAAMSAFKTGSTGRKSRSSIVFLLVGLILVALLAGGGWMFLNRLALQREQATKDDVQVRALADKAVENKNAKEIQEVKAREAELVRQKTLAEDAARKFEAEKRALEERMAKQEAERQKAQAEETVRRLAEERRIREETALVVANTNREKEELRRKVEEAQRISREKLKKEQDEENAKVAMAQAEKAAKAKGAENAGAVEAVKTDTPKATAMTNTVTATQAKLDAPISGNVKTIPPDPAVVPDKLDLPSGGVRLLVKASDPYGGKLFFEWKQLKGSRVEIADPAAAKFLDGKWISQTYFVAHDPGQYEFEVTVKNDEGVESHKKFPIEVLPATTLK